MSTPLQLDLLKSWGGQIAQGFYFAKPLSVGVSKLPCDGGITEASHFRVALGALLSPYVCSPAYNRNHSPETEIAR